jgi:salicylate hydroxylase
MPSESSQCTESYKALQNGGTLSKNDHEPTRTTGSARAGQSLPDWATYPSQSLRFLRTLETETPFHQDAQPTPARLKLNVIIVGAGLGGLALAVALSRRGHSVRILEQAPKLGEVSIDSRCQISS